MSDKISSEEYDFEVKKQSEVDTAYVAIGCVMEMTNILKKGSRTENVDPCKKIGGEEEKSLSKMTHADGTVKYFFGVGYIGGRKILNDAFEDGTTLLTIRITLADATDTVSATTVERDVLVKEIDVTDDTSWKETASFSFVGKPRFTVGA